MLPLGLGLAASVATLAGGALGLRLASRIGAVLGVTAGIVLGVALFDLMPEALALAGPDRSARSVFAFVAVGLCGYMIFERALDGAGGRWRAHLGPATLTLHSFIDGLGMGLAFQVSPAIGWVVAVAVLTHDVADGVNTVSLCLAAERQRAARVWLVVNGMAPLLGVIVGMVMRVPQPVMAPLMAIFAGVFLYIGACELVPRSRALDPRRRTTLASVAGVALMFVVTAVAR
jgi:ZIP family zinc transporter